MRFLPCAFAVIIAASAHAASSRGFIACSGPSERPIETVSVPTPGNVELGEPLDEPLGDARRVGAVAASA